MGTPGSVPDVKGDFIGSQSPAHDINPPAILLQGGEQTQTAQVPAQGRTAGKGEGKCLMAQGPESLKGILL